MGIFRLGYYEVAFHLGEKQKRQQYSNFEKKTNFHIAATSNRSVRMKKGVLTSYSLDNILYSSYVLGECMEQISHAVQMRSLGETIESTITEIETLTDYSSLSDDELRNRLPEVLHSVCYISFIALKSKTISLEEVLGDNGVLHELTHILANVEGCNKWSLGCARDLLRKVQSKATGLYEPV